MSTESSIFQLMGETKLEKVVSLPMIITGTKHKQYKNAGKTKNTTSITK